MSESEGHLAQLVQDLEGGGDAHRLRAARSALNFKRAWVKLAEALVEVQREESYKSWGYADFMEYCTGELGLKRSVVDKLTVSFATLQTHAPERLEPEADQYEPPSYQALDYFSRALGEPRPDGKPARDAPEQAPSDEVVQELHQAVFEEGLGVQQLRQRFDPLIRPKAPAEQQLMATRRVAATARRLVEQLQEVEGLSELHVKSVHSAVEGIQQEIDRICEGLLEEVG